MDYKDTRKIFAMHKLFGRCGILKCQGCSHCIQYDNRSRRYYKCELYGESSSSATDWRLSYDACGMRDVEVDMENWFPVIERLKHATKPPEPPIHGQIKMEF